LSQGRDSTTRALAARAVRRLSEAGATIAVAESCTGGWLGGALTSVPGASAAFWGGVIAYDDDAKLGLLGVSPATLNEHGAVSEPVAREMAQGILAVSGATLGVGITGVAGPDGGTDNHPVGTVFVALAGRDNQCRALWLEGDRNAIRRQSVAAALAMIADVAAGDA
jgi:nicotinamide-nucleotide amidase